MFYLSLILLCHRSTVLLIAMNSIHLKVMIRREKNSLFLLRSLFKSCPQSLRSLFRKKSKREKNPSNLRNRGLYWWSTFHSSRAPFFTAPFYWLFAYHILYIFIYLLYLPTHPIYEKHNIEGIIILILTIW